MDSAVAVQHGVFVGVVGRARLHERRHECGLAREALAGNDQGPAVVSDRAGVHEDPVARIGGDEHPDLGVEQAEGDLERAVLELPHASHGDLVAFSPDLGQPELAGLLRRITGLPGGREDVLEVDVQCGAAECHRDLDTESLNRDGTRR